MDQLKPITLQERLFKDGKWIYSRAASPPFMAAEKKKGWEKMEYWWNPGRDSFDLLRRIRPGEKDFGRVLYKVVRRGEDVFSRDNKKEARFIENQEIEKFNMREGYVPSEVIYEEEEEE
jgi:hypothetical protein